MKVAIEGTELVIRLPITPEKSASGKSLVVASTRGNKQTDVEYNGKRITVGVNAYIPNK
jgi:hypothetical protein